MLNLPARPTADLWQALEWRQVTFTKTRSGSSPVRVADADAVPGLFRLTWIGESWPGSATARPLPQAAGRRPASLALGAPGAHPTLMIGRATSLATALAEQLGKNPEKNHLLTHLRLLMGGGMAEHELRDLAIQWVRAEVTPVADEVERWALARFGQGVQLPLFDIDLDDSTRRNWA